MRILDSGTVTRLYRSLPLWLARNYLCALGGHVGPRDEIAGDGWRAILTDAPDVLMGVVHIGQIQIDFEGEAVRVQGVIAAFENKALRAGG